MIDKITVAMVVVTEVGFHLSSLPSRPALLLLQTLNHNCHFHCFPFSTSRHRFLLLLSPWPLHVRRSTRWDSNSTKSFNFEPNDDNEESDDTVEQWAELLDDFIDSIWIIKVFGSFGWMLPPILFSLLLVNGPKAFLMALALPLGQSTFAFAIQRFQNRDKIKPKRKSKTKKRRPRIYNSKDTGFEDATEGQEGRKQKKGYQSWVYTDDSIHNRSRNDFGGWDELELDSEMDSNLGSSRRAAQKSSRLRGTTRQKVKMKRLVASDDGPLLLRFLVSIFPFLSSWIN